MKRNDDLITKGFYLVIILVLLWGILGSLYVAGKELLGAIGQLANWEFGQQFYQASKGVGVHIITALFLIAIAGFLIWMGQKFLKWINEDTKRRKAQKYKRRNYR